MAESERTADLRPGGSTAGEPDHADLLAAYDPFRDDDDHPDFGEDVWTLVEADAEGEAMMTRYITVAQADCVDPEEHR